MECLQLKRKTQKTGEKFEYLCLIGQIVIEVTAFRNKDQTVKSA